MADVIAEHIANDFYSCFKGNMKCIKCGKIFPDEESVLKHECAIKKIRK